MKRKGTFVLVLALVLTFAAMRILRSYRPHHESRPPQVSKPVIQKPVAPQFNWPVFRGDARLTGIAKGNLPDDIGLLWSFKTGGYIKSSPVMTRGRVFIGSGDGKVYSLCLENGAKAWEFDTRDTVEAPPLIVEESVYFGSLEGIFYSVDIRTGILNWKYETQGKIIGSANWAAAGDYDPKLILVGSYDNSMHCVDSESGEEVWIYRTGNYINGAPAVADGKVVFGGCDAQLHLVSTADGNEITSIGVGSYIAGSAALVDDQAFLSHYGNRLICADLKAGNITWEYGGGSNAAPFFSSPAVNDDRVVVGSRDGNLYCVNRKDGAKLWSFQTRGDVDSSPVICADKVVFGSSDGRIYIVKLSDGALVWSYEIGKPVTGSPAVADGMVVIGDEDGRVYAFGKKKK